MKKLERPLIVLVMITCLIIMFTCLSGCDWSARLLNQSRSEFQQNNPGVATVPVDEDKDGLPDFDSPDADADGQADTDASGAPIEVPKSREGYTRAGTLDLSISELLMLTGALGLPGGTLVGAWWGKRKPIKQMAVMLRSMGDKDPSPEDGVARLVAMMTMAVSEKPELLKLWTAILAEIKKTK